MTKELELKNLTTEQLDNVNGGTFDANKYDERIYNQAGMRTDYCFFAKDKFYIKNTKGVEVSITYKQANYAVEFWKKHHRQPSYEDVAANCKE